MAKTKQIFGQGIFNLAMKATVYGQFVAGEDKDKIKVDKIFHPKITFLEINVGKRRIRHSTTLLLNYEFLDRPKID